MLPYCWRRRDAAVQPRAAAWTTTSTSRARTRRSRSGCGWRPASSRSSGRRPRGRCPSNLAVAVGPDIDYVTVEPAPGLAVRAGDPGERVARGRRGWRAYAKRARRGDGRRDRQGRATSRAAATRRRSTTSPATRTRTRCCSATSSPPRTARASCTWRPRSARTTWSRARPSASRPVVPVDSQGPVHHRGPRLRRPAGVRREQADHRRPQGGHRPARARPGGPARRRSCGTRRTSTPTRTAGAAGTR